MLLLYLFQFFEAIFGFDDTFGYEHISIYDNSLWEEYSVEKIGSSKHLLPRPHSTIVNPSLSYL